MEPSITNRVEPVRFQGTEKHGDNCAPVARRKRPAAARQADDDEPLDPQPHHALDDLA